MSNYNIHSDFKICKNFPIPFYPSIAQFSNFFIRKSFSIAKNNAEIQEIKKKIKGYNNEDIEIILFEHKKISGNAPCLIYLHGGAFSMAGGPIHKKIINHYILKTLCKVIFVDYRLANKYPFPVGVEDCYCSCQWVYDNSDKLEVNKDKIAICGNSAGGCLAASVCLMARDRGSFKPCFQMLVYPVTDARMLTESMKKYSDTPIWNSKLNNKMWKLYLKDGINTKREYASPMEAVSFKGLPPAYIEVSEFDCLRDEGISYAESLLENGINVELYKTVGTVHGFEFNYKSEIVTKSINKRIEALKKTFYD